MDNCLPLAGALACLALPLLAQDGADRPADPRGWSTMSLAATGVDRFAAQMPEADGRGVVIAVLDTGVEVAVPGLDKLPGGGVKVIDVRDFTGQGDVHYSPAEPGEAPGEVVLRDSEDLPRAYTLPAEPNLHPDGVVFHAWLREEDFKNSDLTDLNGDGEEDLEVAIILYPSASAGEPRYTVWMDTDNDRDFGDEKALVDYHVRHDHVLFQRPAPERERPQLSLAVNVNPAERLLSLHFDDGGHGTHVAGIAAGWQMNGDASLNGVAPGAEVISLKIGDNRLAGGATTDGSKLAAVKWAAAWARQHQRPVVVNISYGIDSEREGQSSIDLEIDAVLRDNPLLIVCSSAGNSGPGLSTIGTPSAGQGVFSIAAAMPRETARDGRGIVLSDHAVAYFSSRGGDSLKPDILTPGYATSTVPLWNRGRDLWSGTSMASPYAAGLCARLISAALLADPATPPTRDTVQRALMAGAVPLEGYTVLDQGPGMADLPRAWDAMQALLAAQRPDDPSILSVTTTSPMDGGTANAALWRGLFGPGDDEQSFELQALFPTTTDAAAFESFTRRYRLVPQAAWATPVQETIYLRKTGSAQATVRYAADDLAPGLHVADIHVVEEGAPEGAYPAAVLRSVVIVPEHGDKVEWASQVAPRDWRVNRHFYLMPPGAGSLELELEREEGDDASVALSSLNLANGAEVGGWLGFRGGDPSTTASRVYTTEVEPGVLELVIAGESEREAPYTLRAEVSRVVSAAAGTLKGTKARAKIHQAGTETQRATATARLLGFRATETAKFGGDEDTRWEKSVTVPDSCSRMRVTIEFDRDDFLNFTDVAFGVVDGEGEVLLSSGMGLREEGATYIVRGERGVTVYVQPAYADKWRRPEVEATVTLEHLLTDAPSAAMRPRGAREASTQLVLHPGVTHDLEATLRGAPDAPEKTKAFGEVEVVERGTEKVLLKVELDGE